MKKFLLLFTLFFGHQLVHSQALEQNANWPNADWSLSGSYSSSATVLEANPLITSNFAYDDSDAGYYYASTIAAESPTIDLTDAYDADETWIYINFEFVYNHYNTDYIQLQYWDNTAAAWEDWGDPIEEDTYYYAYNNFCNTTKDDYESDALNIADFSSDQLENFQYRIYFSDGGNYSYGFCISSPTISSQTPPPCPSVSDLNATDATDTSVEISWTENGSAQYWNIDYGPTGFTQGNGTSIVANSNPYTLNNLESNTDYEFYVQANCILYLGDWIGPFSFSTLCPTYDAPFTESFTSYAIPECWSQGVDNNENWYFSSYNSNVNQEGSTISGGYFAYIDNSYYHNDDTSLLTPYVDLSDLDTPALHFFINSYANGYTNVDFAVDFYDGSTWHEDVYTNSEDTDGWELVSIDLSSYTISGAVQARFVADESGTNSTYDDVAIDDIMFNELDYCFPVTNLVANYTTPTSAELTWTDLTESSSWNIQYGAQNFGLGTGTTIEADSNPYTLTDLEDNTTYDIYVQNSCTDDNSSWMGPLTITTPCQETAPYSQPFGYYTPTCWNNNDNTYPYWYFTTYNGDSGNNGDMGGTTISGSYFAYVNSNSLTYYDDGSTLTTPFVDVSDLEEPAIHFFYNSHNEGGGNLDFSVAIFDGTSWQEDAYTSNENTDGWEFITIDLSDYTITGAVAARFHANYPTSGSAYYDDIAIDDVMFDELEVCLPPTSIEIEDIQVTTANVSWDNLSDNYSSWNIEYGEYGFTQGNGTSVTTDTNPYTLTDLENNTTYSVYVQTDCDDDSEWQGPYTFTTACQETAPYIESFSYSTPDCWNNNENTYPSWNFSTYNYNSGNNGTMDGATISGSYFTYIDASYLYYYNNGTTLTTPFVDVSDLETPAIHFFINSNNQGSGNIDFSVAIFDGTTWQEDAYTSDENTDGWEFVSIDLSDYTITGAVAARFHAEYPSSGAAYYDDLALDDVMFDELDVCFPPVDTTIGSITTDSAAIEWADLDESYAAWNIEYGTSGFTQGNGTTIATDTNPYTLTDLESNTTYDVYIQTSCTNNSVWQGPYTFTTECAETAPYWEDFSSNSTPECWTNNSSYPYWYFNNYNYYSGNYGNMGDTPTLSGTYFAYIDDSYTHNGTELSTPNVDVSTLTTPALHFYINSNGQGYGNVEFSVDLYDGTDWNTEIYTSNTNTDGWELVSIDLSDYTITGPVQAIFKIDEGDTYHTRDDFAIDDVMFDEYDLCLPVSAGSYSDVSADDVELTWSYTDDNTTWNVQYGETGFNLGNGTTVVANEVPYTLTGLESATTYDVYIQNTCDSSDYSSSWYGPITFTTLNDPPPAPEGITCTEDEASYIFTEEFDTVGDWTGDLNTTYPRWSIPGISTYTATGPSEAYSGENFMNFRSTYAYSNNSASVVSPAIDLTSASEAVELSFYMHAYGIGMGTLNVGISTSQSGPFTNLYTWIGQYQTASTDAWVPIGIDISDYAGETVYIQFKQTTGTSYYYFGDMAIDYMRVQACADFCNVPTDIATSDITATTASVTWTDANANTEDTWEYIIQASGTEAPSEAGNAVTENSVSLEGLTPDTTYDVYVRSKCDEDSYSVWSEAHTFTTLFQTDYTIFCSAGPTNISYCYENNDDTTFHFTSSDGSTQLNILFNAGMLVDENDEITIYDSDETTVLYEGNGTDGDLTGINYQSTGTDLYVEISSNATGSCSDATESTPLDFSVNCYTCVSPTVAYTVVSDCAEQPQFVVNVDITSLGSADTLTITDNQGSTPVTATTTDIYILGPYYNSTDVVVTVANSEDQNCAVTSSSMTQEECPTIYDVACNTIEAGDDQTIDCGTTEVELEANFTFSGTNTNSYQLTSTICEPEIEEGTSTQINADDIYSSAIDLGFDFCFFGNTYDQIVIGANGVVTFDVSKAGTVCPWSIGTTELPTTSLPLNAIFGVYQDINPATCGNIEYLISGEAPNRAFVINYNEVCLYACSSTTTSSQIILHEATNAIEINIIDKPLCTSWNGGRSVAGLQNADGTIAYAPPGRNTGVWTAEDEYWRYVPSGPANYTFNWLDGDGSTVLSSDSDITVSPLETTTYTAQISYNKCDGTLATLTDEVTVNVNSSVPEDEFNLEEVTELIPVTSENTGNVASDAYTFNSYIEATEEPTASCFSDNVTETQWFSFVAPYSGEVNINTYIPDGASDVEIAVYDGSTTYCTELITAGTEIACATGTSTAALELTGDNSITAGETYYIQVNNPADATENFGIEVVQVGCIPPSYETPVISNDCENDQFYIDFEISDLGNGTPSITDGTTTWTIEEIGSIQTGPFDIDATVTLTMNHGEDSVCDINLGEFTSICPPLCASNISITPDEECGNYNTEITWDATANATGYYISAGTTTGGSDIFDNLDIGDTTEYFIPGSANTTYYVTLTPYNEAGIANACSEYSYTTVEDQCYCISEPGALEGDGITNVSIEDSNFTPTEDETYTNFTATPVTVEKGVNTTIEITFEIGYPYDYAIWVDYNDDYILDTTTELIASGTSGYSNPNTQQAMFTVPDTVSDGEHYMRLVSASTGTAIDPCYNGGWGVTLDFMLNVTSWSCEAATYDTATVTADCDNSQFYVDVNITDLGNGSPSITDGTTTWDITETGNTQVGPFSDGASVDLTLTHGTDATCDTDLGTFTYTCPVDCSPATYETPTITADCDSSQFYVDVNVTDLGNGSPSITDGTTTWYIENTGTTQVGPFDDGDSVQLTLNHGTDTTCDAVMGTFTYTCPIPCEAASYETPTINADCDNSQFYIDVNITDLGNGSPAITDGTTTWDVENTGITQVGPFTDGASVELTLTHGTDTTCDSDLGTFTYTCPIPCIAATYDTATVSSDCDNSQFYVDVNITDLGNGSPSITDGITTWDIAETGTTQVGPFTDGASVDLTLTNGTDTNCDTDLGTFTYTCPIPCEAATYDTATVSSDCDNNQFYVDVNITDLGNGSPSITDGTTTWDIAETGTTQVGPFDDGDSVELTLTHGTDNTCNVDLGTFTYTCPIPCEAATYDTATVSTDCDNSQFYVDVNITDLGNGSPSITDGTTTWDIAETGTTQVGPFTDGASVELTLTHGTDTTCDSDLGTFTYTCPIPCEAATYDTATVSSDCDNSQFYVDVNITDLGNGSPAITDGTTTWDIENTGITQVGPFTDGDSVELTLTHGTDTDCDTDLGTFTYTCPTPPVNNDLCNAIALTVLASSEAGTTAGDAYSVLDATMQTDEPLPTCFDGTINGSVWFSFVAPESGEVEITTDLTGGSLTDTEIALYSASGVSCATLNTLADALGCDQDGADDVPNNSTLTYSEENALTPGATYYIQVDYSGTAGTFGIEVIELDTAGVKDINGITLNYYPNPVKYNKLNLEANMPINSIEIYNMLGQKVISLTPKTTNYTIDMKPLAGGNYIIKVLVGEHLKTIKITKE